MQAESQNQEKHRSLTIPGVFLTLFAAVALAACGGGDGGSGSGNASPSTSNGTTDAPPPAVTADAVTEASKALATQAGAVAVPGTSATAQAFDLTAQIGDTWRLVLNDDGTFTLKVLSTQYALSDTSGTFTKSGSGNFVTYTGANGMFTVTVDQRTRSIAGKVTLGGRASGVTGTGYSVPADTSKLAGDYFYIGSTQAVSTGTASEFDGGTFRIAANGTDVTLCERGQINSAGGCTALPGTDSATARALKLVRNPDDGLFHVQLDGSDFGLLSFQAGDRGPVLVIDRFGYDQSTPPVLRSGAFYAARQAVLSGNEANGTWECSYRGDVFGTMTISGTTVKTVSTDGKTNDAETLYYNKVSTNTGLAALNGATTSVVNGEAPSEGVILLPLSSSLAVVERDAQQSVAVCRAM